MPKVFRSTQIETTKIILSGGVGSSGIGGLIYSGSVATDMVGGIPATMLSNVGRDTMLFVSGVIGGKGSSGVVVFGGDTVISGSLTIGTGSVTITSNEVRFQGGAAKITSSSNGLTFFDSQNTAGVSLTTLSTAVAAQPAYFSSTTNGSIFTTGSAAFRSGESSVDSPADKGGDVFFYVSGAVGSKGTSNKGLALFGGDLHVSGNFSLAGSTTGVKPNHVFNEYLGQGNGTNTLFTLDYTPTANKNVSVFVNGLLQMTSTTITGAPYQDYSITGSNIYFTSASIPDVDSVLIANYLTNDSI